MGWNNEKHKNEGNEKAVEKWARELAQCRYDKYSIIKFPSDFGAYSETIPYINDNDNRYDIDEFNFNTDSNINPVSISEAEYYNTHDKISNHLKQKFVVVDFAHILEHNIKINSVYQLMESTSQIVSINISISKLLNYKISEEYEETIILTNNDLIAGILCLYIWPIRPCVNGTVNAQIHARTIANACININNIDWDFENGIKIVQSHYNSKYYAQCEENIKYKSKFKHKISWQQVSTNMFTQMDGKQFCTELGFSGMFARHPCWACTVTRQTINSPVSPNTLKFHFRTLKENADNCANITGEGCIHSEGVTHYPVLQIPLHKMGFTSLHDIGGSAGILMQTIENIVGLEANNNIDMIAQKQALCIELNDAQFKYLQIKSIYDRHKYLNNHGDPESGDELVLAWYKLLKEAEIAKNQIEVTYNMCEEELKLNDLWCAWYKMKSEQMKIRGNYFHENMVDGHDAECLIYKNKYIIDFLKNKLTDKNDIADKIELLFVHFKLVHHFCMSKSNEPVTDFQLLQFKKALISFIDLFIKIVKEFRNVNGVGNKIHDYIHVYLNIEHYRINGAVFNETRVENANQSLLDISKNYLRYKKYDRLSRMARAIHLKVLFNDN